MRIYPSWLCPSNNAFFLVLTHRAVAIIIAKADITAILIGAAALTTSGPAVTTYTALKDGIVIIARAGARLANAAVPINTSAIIRSAWMVSAGIRNVILTTTANGDIIVSILGYAKNSVHQTALVRILSAVQSTIQGRHTDFAGISRNQKRGVCWRYCAVNITLRDATVGYTRGSPSSRTCACVQRAIWRERNDPAGRSLVRKVRLSVVSNPFPRANVSIGRRQDTELWNNQISDSKISFRSSDFTAHVRLGFTTWRSEIKSISDKFRTQFGHFVENIA